MANLLKCGISQCVEDIILLQAVETPKNSPVTQNSSARKNFDMMGNTGKVLRDILNPFVQLVSLWVSLKATTELLGNSRMH